MKTFKQFFLEQQAETVALYPGGFKPPTKGHFEVMKDLLENADSGVVFIGRPPRDEIDQDMAYQIWSVYAPYLGKPVQIVKSQVTPVTSVYEYAADNPTKNIIVGVGKKDEDKSRYNSFLKNPEKYKHVKIAEVDIKGDNISGTLTREKIAAKDPAVIDYFVPVEISDRDKDNIKTILGIA